MSKFKEIVILIFALLLTLSGCDTIDYEERGYETRPSEERPDPAFTDNQSLFYPITRRPFYEKHQMEELTAYEYYDNFDDFEGKGYIKLEESWSADFELNLPAPQHYAITLRIRAEEEAVVSLTAGGEIQGAYYVKSGEGFKELTLRGIYLEQGVNRLALTQLKGVSYVDELIVNDSELPDTRFNSSRLPANPNASISARLLMDYLGEIFGKKILLAQHVTPGTNTELNALLEGTGRLPAIRASDMMRYSRSFIGEKPANDDITLALEWASRGGLVAYDWTWYSPSVNGGASHYYAGASSLNFNEAFNTASIADLDTERLQSLQQAGAISLTCYELILEIDHMAENLKRFQSADVPVLWRPMHQASTRWFWWGNCDPEVYKWFWKLMFERYSNFHGLDNLIWVWTGQSPEYYPGDEYVDIIGQDNYNRDDASGIPVFWDSANYSKRPKLTAMTEAGLMPSPDLMNRDRAMWLWTALYRGDYLVDSRGRLASLYNQKDRMERIYNHEITITLDKLPKNY